MSKKIIIEHVRPPIPTTAYDYCAYFDGEEELGHYGYGATEDAALDDFLSSYGCKNETEYCGQRGECLACPAECGEACQRPTPPAGKDAS